MSNKRKDILLIIFLTPIIWYMAPYINSIQIASLFFLWSYYFINKYDKGGKISHLIFSGIFFGLAAAFWHAIFFFGIFFIFIFMYDKKVLHLLYYLIMIIIGLIPLFILDYNIFGSIFYSLIKNNLGTLSNLVSLGIYSVDATAKKNLLTLIPIFIFLPLYCWRIYTKEVFKKHRKTVIFLSISILIILKNPQIRYLLLIVPILIIILFDSLNEKQLKRLLKISSAITICIISFYVLYNFYPLGEEIRTQELIQIGIDYPNETFLVGPWADDYERLAIISWNNNIKEFVSIQDYELWLNNNSILIERELRFTPIINDRREFWISGGVGKSSNDKTDYESINYLIQRTKCDPLTIDNFILDKEYEILSVYKKTEEINNE